jgi:hypothetical protein
MGGAKNTKKKSATPEGCAESTPKEEGGGDTGTSDEQICCSSTSIFRTMPENLLQCNTFSVATLRSQQSFVSICYMNQMAGAGGSPLRRSISPARQSGTAG